MKIKIISLRRSNDKAICLLEEEYLKRFSIYAKVDMIDIKRARLNHNKSALSDLAKLKSSISQNDYCVMLTESGKQYSTEQFTDYLKKTIHSGTQCLTFLIGGPEGFPVGVEELVHFKLSLSKMTFPHKLVRLLLIEALYRSFDVLRGGKYNK